MPQGRILLKSISQSRKVAMLRSDGARLLYTWCVAHADVEGVLYGEPGIVNSLVFTRLGKQTSTIKQYLENLESERLIISFQHNGERFIMLPDFVEKQPNLRPSHEGKPLVPPSITTKLRSNYSQTTAEVKESKVKESKSNYCRNKTSTVITAESCKQPFFNFDTRQWDNITADDYIQWGEAYPACNVPLEIRQMAQWLLANPDKRKKNYRRFITNWLSRSQERGGTKGTNNGDGWAAKKTKQQEGKNA